MHLNEHRVYFLDRNASDIDSIKTGDVIEFGYQGMTRHCLVLNPSYRNKLHAVDLNLIRRTSVLVMLRYLPLQTPYEFYQTYYARQSLLAQADAYRTYTLNKINNLYYIPYDVWNIKGAMADNVRWRRPRLTIYKNKIKRAESKFNLQDGELLKKLQNAQTQILSDTLWSQLEDTISYEIRPGDVGAALKRSVERGWPLRAAEAKLDVFKKGGYIEAPIVVESFGEYFLITGELTLMFCRALQVLPVIIKTEVN